MSSAAPTAALRGDPIYFRRAFPIGLSSSSCPAFYKAEGTRDETYDCQEACSSCKIVRATHSITGPSRLYKISSNVRCLLGAGLVDSFEYHAVILALDLAILTPNPRPAPNVHQYGEYHLRLGDAWMSRSPNRPTTPYHDVKLSETTSHSSLASIPVCSNSFSLQYFPVSYRRAERLHHCTFGGAGGGVDGVHASEPEGDGPLRRRGWMIAAMECGVDNLLHAGERIVRLLLHYHLRLKRPGPVMFASRSLYRLHL